MDFLFEDRKVIGTGFDGSKVLFFVVRKQVVWQSILAAKTLVR